MTQVANLHNTRSGRVFVLGNGPSLLTQLDELASLSQDATFACNGWFWWDRAFTPTHYGITDHKPHEVRHFVHEGQKMERYHVAHAKWYDYDRPHPAFVWVEKAWEGKITSEGFKGLDETLPPLPTGNCAPLTLAQVAAWLGYREFAFLGMDGTNLGHMYNPTPESTGRPGGPPRSEWGRRQAQSMLACFARARRDIEAAGGRIYDCTPNGLMVKEGVLPYVPLKEALRVGVPA